MSGGEAKGLTQKAREDAKHERGQNVGQHVHAAGEGGLAPHRLEVDGHPVRGEERGAHDSHGDEAGGDDDAVADDGGGDEGVGPLAPLPGDEDEEEDARAAEEADDGGAGPGVDAAAPLQGEEQHDGRGGEEEEADEVEAAVEGGQDVADGADGGLVGDGDEEGAAEDDGAEGEVDVEA